MTIRLLALFLSTLFLAFPGFIQAQQQKKAYRVSYLSPRLGIESREEALRQSLRELGYVEGQNLAIDWRFSKGNADLIPELAAELLRSRPDCVIATGVTAIRTFKQLTETIPIVMATIEADPVELGFIASLARPGGNITGFTRIAYDLAGKRLELIKESVPKARRAAILVGRAAATGGQGAAQAHIRETEIAARALKVQLQVLEVRKPEDLDGAFQQARKGRAEILSVVGTGLINSHRSRIINLSAKHRYPTIYSLPDFVFEGGLMSYGADPVDQHRRVAVYVDKILKGTKASELPVQQPMKFEFIVNLNAAKQIGFTVPPNVLVRADKVIK